MTVMVAYFFCFCAHVRTKHITALCITVTCRPSSWLVKIAGFPVNKGLKNETATQCHLQLKYEQLKLNECKLQNVLHSKYKLASSYMSVLLHGLTVHYIRFT